MILNLNTKQLFNVYEYDSMVDPDHVKEVMWKNFGSLNFQILTGAR
jgi:hypothetical protein